MGVCKIVRTPPTCPTGGKDLFSDGVGGVFSLSLPSPHIKSDERETLTRIGQRFSKQEEQGHAIKLN